ncbi:hypothetical protein U9M48_005660 [Paspalum notatum var. saurae]|uniref:TNase-like domain-containing protein n=1 Tax=Paspalum notatum var. saurae TaxID=547442 RepID=A0AAQ3PRE3_PASNO
MESPKAPLTRNFNEQDDKNFGQRDTCKEIPDQNEVPGVDAPELKMANGEESKNALVELIGGKRVTIYVYGQDQFERYVGDIYCDNVFIQERMLKSGHVWHFKNYDKRPEFAQWEREARAARRGLFASENPEKPWHWRRDQRSANIPVY